MRSLPSFLQPPFLVQTGLEITTRRPPVNLLREGFPQAVFCSAAFETCSLVQYRRQSKCGGAVPLGSKACGWLRRPAEQMTGGTLLSCSRHSKTTRVHLHSCAYRHTPGGTLAIHHVGAESRCNRQAERRRDFATLWEGCRMPWLPDSNQPGWILVYYQAHNSRFQYSLPSAKAIHRSKVFTLSCEANPCQESEFRI